MAATLLILLQMGLTAVGGALVISNGRDIYFGLASRRWARTRGKIVSIDTHEGTPWHGDSAAILTYEYDVGGIVHRSRRYDFAGRNAGPTAGLVLLEMQVGTWVPVSYDPNRPERSVLRTGVGLASFASVVAGIAIGTVGLLGLIGAALSAVG